MSDEFTDIFSRHAHFVERYKSGVVKEIDPILRRIIKGLRGELLKTRTVIGKTRIKQKLDFVEALLSGELSEYSEIVAQNIEQFATSEAGFTAKTLAQQNALFEVIIPAQAQLTGAVRRRPFNTKLLKDYLKDFPKEQAAAVRNAIAQGFAEGQTTESIVRQIVGTKAANFQDGLLNVTRTSAKRMARTALAHTSTVARGQVFEDNADLIPFYEWVSTLDSRTSDICMGLDGTVYKVGKGKLPPAHFNCRSTTSPLFKDEVEINAKGELSKKDNLGGVRSSLDGPVNADLNYNDWLGKQTKEFQIEALGPTKAKLFRDGDMKVSQFTNRDNMPLTIKELEKKYPISWKKANL